MNHLWGSFSIALWWGVGEFCITSGASCVKGDILMVNPTSECQMICCWCVLEALTPRGIHVCICMRQYLVEVSVEQPWPLRLCASRPHGTNKLRAWAGAWFVNERGNDCSWSALFFSLSLHLCKSLRNRSELCFPPVNVITIVGVVISLAVLFTGFFTVKNRFRTGGLIVPGQRGRTRWALSLVVCLHFSGVGNINCTC